ncbi:hypothetical protein OAJ65_03465 [Flavobacteriales bacterium]|nr:hypothetical protein [Flavobacteriales bacterium]
MSEKSEITIRLVQKISLYIEQNNSAKLHDLIADLNDVLGLFIYFLIGQAIL